MAIVITTGTSQIREWRSIVTLIVFVVTNIIVLLPFHIPIYVPRPIWNAFLDALSGLRVISPRQHQYSTQHDPAEDDNLVRNAKNERFKVLRFPMNFVTAPLVADLFLLAILAIGRQEVHDGTIGAENIQPLDIMVFFLTLAYIAISIDASGLIRYLAFKVLQKGGGVGHRLFFYLYAFFFALGTFIGNDPIILSGTAFLAYMTRVSSNIIHPRAWIHTQFAIANIASAILVTSNPTNLVLSGAFSIKFIEYTYNMIVPVVVTAIVLFPFLLYIVFAEESLIPIKIKMHELSDEAKARRPVNPNIPNARGNAEEEEKKLANDDKSKLLSLEEIMNPFVDKRGAAFGAIIMATTLVVIVVLNAVSQSRGEHPVFWVTLPAAFVMFSWDLGFGWYHRHETREIARQGRRSIEDARAEQAVREEEEGKRAAREQAATSAYEPALMQMQSPEAQVQHERGRDGCSSDATGDDVIVSAPTLESSVAMLVPGDEPAQNDRSSYSPTSTIEKLEEKPKVPHAELDEKMFTDRVSRHVALQQKSSGQTTLISLSAEWYRWSQETFPTCMAVIAHLPFALVPFAFSMFVLVQALVSKGWVQVFAFGWDNWVNKTGTVGAIGGMGFLSVILCNFAGTNIGTTILLSRVIQHWQQIHRDNGIIITDRTFWATVYAMALGVNFGAFSAAFSASLAGLLWRDILARKHIRVRSLDFARVNLPIIAIAMAVGCAVLVAEVYLFRHDTKYKDPNDT